MAKKFLAINNTITTTNSVTIPNFIIIFFIIFVTAASIPTTDKLPSIRITKPLFVPLIITMAKCSVWFTWIDLCGWIIRPTNCGCDFQHPHPRLPQLAQHPHHHHQAGQAPPRHLGTKQTRRIMFAKLKSNSGSPTSSNSLLDLNPISQYFEIGKQIGSAGPELVWKIFEAVKKSDRKVIIIQLEWAS